jgi:hypothetical protein
MSSSQAKAGNLGLTQLRNVMFPRRNATLEPVPRGDFPDFSAAAQAQSDV